MHDQMANQGTWHTEGRRCWRGPAGIGLFLALAATTLGPSTHVASQEVATPEANARVRVFLDCEPWICDFDHLRRNAAFVDYVRDRQDADLHVLVTEVSTAAGGEEFSLHVLGLDRFESRADTLRFVSRPDDTEDEVREGITRTFGLALARYVAETDAARGITIGFEPPSQASALGALPVHDPWNLWVFRARVSGEVEGESRQDARAFDGSFSANRTTEALKLDFFARFNYQRDRFELNDEEELLSTRRDFDVGSSAVWSLGDHWSAGGMASAAGNTRRNQSLGVRAGPALEFSVFPYTESTRRQITFMWATRLAYFDYEEETIFEKTRELRPEQTLDVSLEYQEPWGSATGSVSGTAFLDDLSQHRLDLFARFELRLFRGVSLDVRGNVARVKNQIYIPLGEIPDEDILLERRQLGTDFEYEMDVGISFTFGSVFNNVVNPRMSNLGHFD